MKNLPRHLFFAITLVFYSNLMIAQTPYNFSGFHYRYQEFRGMDLHANLSATQKDGYQNYGYNNKLNAGLNYFSYLNTEKKQQTVIFNAFASPEVNFYKSKSTYNSVSNFNFSYQTKNYRNNLKFIGYELIANANFLSDRTIFTSHTNSLSPSAKAFIGKGRAEYITDVVSVVRLFDELKLNQLLLRDATTEQINAFAQIIVDYNRTRILDSRLNKIAMIEAMINYLKSEGLVNDANAKVFAILNDQIYFAINVTRFSGNVSELGLIVNSSTQTSNNKSDTSIISQQTNNFTPGIFYSHIKYRAVSLKKQENMGIEASINHGFSSNDRSSNIDSVIVTTSYNSKNPNILLSVFYDRGYYPNTRTYLTWTNRISIQGDQFNNNNIKVSSMYTSFNSGLNLYYYFSPQLRLSINDGLFISNYTNLTKNSTGISYIRVNNSLIATLNYALF